MISHLDPEQEQFFHLFNCLVRDDAITPTVLIDCRRAFGRLAAKQAIFEFTDLIDADRLSSRLEMTGLVAIWRIKGLVLQIEEPTVQ